MSNKVLSVKEYLKEKSLEGIDERLTQAFVKYIQQNNATRVFYKKDKPECNVIKLKTRLVLSDSFPLKEIYEELIRLSYKMNGALILKSLHVTPEIIEQGSLEKFRGIIAQIKSVR